MATNTNNPEVSGGIVSGKWRYDGTVTLGHLLTITTILIAGVGLYTSTVVKLSSHEARIAALEKLAEAQNQYNKTSIDILNELKQGLAVSEALAKDRELRQRYMPVPEELKQKRPQ